MLDSLKKFDWIIIFSSLLLTAIGLLSLYSLSFGRGDILFFKKQVVFLLIGFFLMFIFGFFDWRVLKENSYLIIIIYFLCIISLIGLYFFASSVRGVKSWYQISIFSINPIEFTKIVLIIILAKYFSTRHIEMYRLKHIIISSLYVLLPSIIVFFQPEFGSILIFGLLWIGILIISGIRLRHFIILFICAAMLLSFIWFIFLKDYQKERIIGFLGIKSDPLGIGWSQNQAKIAIGSGGIWGKGFFKGSQTQYGFLPEPYTDFIFAAIAEESGLIGVSFVFFLFALLIWRIVKIALLAESNFPRLFAMGFSFVLIFHIFVNIGMNLSIMPVIGIPLPFVSYGGSNLIANFIGLGIIQSIKYHRISKDF